MQTIQNAIDGRKVTSASRRLAPVYDPATGEQTAELPLSTADEVNSAVAAAKDAAAGWGATPPLKRIKPMFRFKQLLDRHADDIARAISTSRSYSSAAGPATTKSAGHGPRAPSSSCESRSPPRRCCRSCREFCEGSLEHEDDA